MPFSVINLRQTISAHQLEDNLKDPPSNELASPFPVLASFKARVSGDKLLQYWV